MSKRNYPAAARQLLENLRVHQANHLPYREEYYETMLCHLVGQTLEPLAGLYLHLTDDPERSTFAGYEYIEYGSGVRKFIGAEFLPHPEARPDLVVYDVFDSAATMALEKAFNRAGYTLFARSGGGNTSALGLRGLKSLNGRGYGQDNRFDTARRLRSYIAGDGEVVAGEEHYMVEARVFKFRTLKNEVAYLVRKADFPHIEKFARLGVTISSGNQLRVVAGAPEFRGPGPAPDLGPLEVFTILDGLPKFAPVNRPMTLDNLGLDFSLPTVESWVSEQEHELYIDNPDDWVCYRVKDASSYRFIVPPPSDWDAVPPVDAFATYLGSNVTINHTNKDGVVLNYEKVAGSMEFKDMAEPEPTSEEEYHKLLLHPRHLSGAPSGEVGVEQPPVEPTPVVKPPSFLQRLKRAIKAFQE